MSRILINDLLKFDQEKIDNVRIKFNIYNGNAYPLELYKENPDQVNIDWLLWNEKRHYFSNGQIAICLLRLSDDTWLLTTIKKITKVLDVTGGIGYEADEIPDYAKYYGRVIVKYHNTSKSMGRRFDSVMNELEVLEILNYKYTGYNFPGFENIRLSYSQLKTIIERSIPD